MSKKIKTLLRTIKLGTIKRAAQFDREAIDEDNRTVELSYSSEEPYERYWGVEILGHNPDEVDLARMNNSGALLMDHNTSDQVGVIEKAWIDGASRKGRALVRFGKSARASEIFQDVIDGIRRNVSVSYDIQKMALVKSEKMEGGTGTLETYRVNKWMPLEISLVSVPADATVGVGRANENEALKEVIIENNQTEEKNKMKKCNICGAEYEGNECPVCARAKEAAERSASAKAAADKTRMDEIMAMGKKHNLVEDAVRFITEGKSVADFKDFVIDKVTAPGRTNLDNEDRSAATSPDQPIYRGSAATMLGQQLMDVRIMAQPQSFNTGIVREARSRVEQSQKRSIECLEKQLKEENRTATSGGMTIGVPTEGGVFLQGETAVELMTNGINNSEILPRTAKRTLTATQYVEIIGIDEESRVDGSRGGGIRVYTNKELGEFTASKTKFSKIRVEPQKLTGLFPASGEMMRNVTFMGQEVRQLFTEEFSFKGQDLVMRGSGAGESLGILNAGCLVSVPKETGQKAKTIVSQNLSNMWARFRGKNPAWFINRDCGPQLDQLSVTAGTSALEPRFVTYDAQGIMRIKGAPVVEIEQCETLGTVGDIVLADWSQYVCADKGDIMEAMSIHVDFIYDQELYRFISYLDGQPRWKTAITPYKGANSVSPFVALATRA